jgi:hypothetical protein
MKHRTLVIRAFVVIVVTTVACGAAEVATRVVDGYRITQPRLELSRARSSPPISGRPAAARKWWVGTDAWSYVAALPKAAGVDRQWFLTQPPDRALPPPDADLERRARLYPRIPLEASYEWNRRVVRRAICQGYDGYEATFNQLDDLYVFDAIDGSDRPTFRFLRNASYASGLHTNRFGWRGPDIALNKPPHTIRIGFVGASTTVGFHAEPYSYPEVVGFWLERWAHERHPDLSIEAINAGREGVNSTSLQAIVRQELIPAEPDLVVYYEGANQFWPGDFISTPLPLANRVAGRARNALSAYSAVARRMENLIKRLGAPGSEPFKPALTVDWPSDLPEFDPDLASPRLPIQLPRILADLETIRQALDAEGSRLVMTSFEWLVYPGMILDPERDAVLFDYLNTKYWPFSYAHMRRLLDFQNRVFRKFASVHGLDFIDVAGAFPSDPRLFDDAIHMTRAGTYLHAWIVFNGLVPVIERYLTSHEWPRPVRQVLSQHPAFGERRLVPMTDVRAACAAESP